jgi:mRNA-degrading endonuclease RelE of RelBE toxin-antitoxin system
MYDIVWKPKARKQLRKIGDRSVMRTVGLAVMQLSAFPACTGVKHLENYAYGYRLRVGRYRVLFDVRDTVRIIEIQEVKKRDERTY